MPLATTRFAQQQGHWLPFALRLMDACHLCPHLEHFHQYFLLLLGRISLGVKLPFLVGCHSFASLGYKVSKSFTPTKGACFEQFKQPCPLEHLFSEDACHSYPHFVHCHQTLYVEPTLQS